MIPDHLRALRNRLICCAGAAALTAAVGLSVSAAEPHAGASAGPAPECGSIDPGFSLGLEDTLRGRGLDPGFSPRRNDGEPAAGGGSIDPGFSRPIETCPAQRLQELLGTPSSTPPGFDPASTPSTQG